MENTLKESLRRILEPVGQLHLLHFWAELTSAEQENLAAEINSVDWDKVTAWAREALAGQSLPIPFDKLTPAPYVPLSTPEPADFAECRLAGLELLRSGKVAGFTVAGGQGTRLGYDGPKGTYRFTPLRQASLFQLFAESIRRSQQKLGCTLPWYVMTSPANHQQTVDFFAANAFFGLDASTVMFFRQGTLPAFDLDGKAILQSKGALALSANGHGGSFAALQDSGALDDMRQRGIEVLSYWQVDNPLVTLFDPLFIGMHRRFGSEMSSRALIKRDAREKLGHFCRLDGKTIIIEYSDMPDALLARTDAAGELLYRAGSPAIHLLECGFIRRLTNGSLDFKPHKAMKKVPSLRPDGTLFTPETANAVKLEFFLFDALPLAAAALILEADRQEQFAPIKNAEGEDSPESCRLALQERTARWLEAAGCQVPRGPDGTPALILELAPHLAVDAEDVKAIWGKAPLTLSSGSRCRLD